MSIEEGETVITHLGTITEVIDDNYTGADNVDYVKLKTDGCWWRPNDLVKANAPIRAKVEAEWQAEALVALAEEHGFNRSAPGLWEEDVAYNLNPNNMNGYWGNNEPDLTFTDDLKQIESWIQFHGEDEFCDRCGNEKVIRGQGESIPCPDCSDDHVYGGYDRDEVMANQQPPEYRLDDESEDEPYDGPRREDDPFERLMESVPFIAPGMDQTLVMEYISDYIDDLEQELSDFWENQQEYKDNVDRLLREKAKLKQELEDMREELDEVKEILLNTEGDLHAVGKQRDEFKSKIETIKEVVNDVSV